jgi:flagellar biogenesis protein FliO
MFLWCIKIALISIILICIIHNLYFFLQSNLLVPKIKNFIDIPNKYENMMNVISTEENVSLLNKLPLIPDQIIHNEIPEEDKEENEDKDMKEELKHFLKSEL